MYIKWIKAGTILFLAVYLIFLCRIDSAKDIPLSEIAEVMGKEDSVTALEKCGDTQLRKFYGIDASKIEGYFFYKAESPMSVDEILIIKARDKAQAEDYLESAETHLQSQKKSFEGYGVTQTALLNEAIVECRGNYVFYAAGEKAEQWKKEFVALVR